MTSAKTEAELTYYVGHHPDGLTHDGDPRYVVVKDGEAYAGCLAAGDPFAALLRAAGLLGSPERHPAPLPPGVWIPFRR